MEPAWYMLLVGHYFAQYLRFAWKTPYSQSNDNNNKCVDHPQFRKNTNLSQKPFDS